MRTTELRQELLIKLAEGYNKREIVKYCMDRFQVSDSAVYQHIKKMPIWTKNYLSLYQKKKAYTDMLSKWFDSERRVNREIETETDSYKRNYWTRTLIEIRKQIGLLQGLYQPEIHDQEVKTIELKWLPPAQEVKKIDTQTQTS